MKVVHRVLSPDLGRQVPAGLCALAVMTKAPRAGQVKTRLTPPLTAAEAAAINICFLQDTTAAITATEADGRARGIGVYTPVGEENAFAEVLPSHFALVAQRGAAFGERLTAAAEDLFEIGFDSVCLINSDSPTVPQNAYMEAVRLLSDAGDRIVLGPSDDGGYYLIGLKQVHARVFGEIAWSTEHVFGQTLERAQEIGVPVKLLPTWYDVDDRAMLRRLCAEFFEPADAPAGFPAPATRAFLTDIIAREGRARVWPL
ncbi:MAG TPA: TIGR04282 family arsenosugar biosynthesis glycosyltransferase [Chthoniobacterales bacterium]|nr:TIGR04282 family arsenosugar biosynthesis glycosyltransferase [Chthoniobacterales bacterium]